MPSLTRPRVEYRTPGDLVREVKNGLIRIPQFQRNFKWEATDILKLFDSVLKGFPVGNLLLWQRSAASQQVQIGPLTISAPASDAALWVVDGQQRITSLVGALTSAHEATDARFRVHLDLDTSEFHTTGARQSAPVTWIPVSLLPDTRTLLPWMRENAQRLTDAQLEAADRAAKAMREYQIPTYIVTAADDTQLLEIFTRMNTAGKRLNKSEVFQALHSSNAPDDYPDLASIGRVPIESGFGAFDDQLVLRAVLAHLGGDVYRDDFRADVATLGDQTETFRDVAAAVREVVRFLQGDAGIPHVKLLPYSHVVPVLVRFVKVHGTPDGRSATLLRRWIWRGAVAGTRAGGVSVPDVRAQIDAVQPGDPVDSAQRILARVQSYSDFLPELDKVHFGHAMAKLNVLGLLSFDPRDPDDGTPLPIGTLLDQGSPLRQIVPAKTPLAATMANRAIALASGRALQRQLASATPDIAASHLVDEEAQRLLASGAFDTFLQRRAEAVTDVISDHVGGMAEWGARDGQAIRDLIRSAP